MKKNKQNLYRFNSLIKTFLLGGITLLVASCTDFLTTYPTTSIVLENYWKDKSSVENMVANSYKDMVTADFIMRAAAWGELRSENVVEGKDLKDDLLRINEANILPTNGYCNWSIFYKIINNCNIVLKYAPGVLELDPDFTSGDFEVVQGEMLAIRALCHFYLVRTFRDIPLLTEAMIDDSQYLYQKQVTPLEAIDCILADLHEAENKVLESGAYATEAENKGRITRDAVQAIIADALLWKAAFTQFETKGTSSSCSEYYTECAQYCDSIINARKAYLEALKLKNGQSNLEEDESLLSKNSLVSKYPLEQFPLTVEMMSSSTMPYSLLFGTQMNDTKESIFELQNEYDRNQNYAAATFYGYGTKVGPFMAPLFATTTGESNSLFSTTDYRRTTYINVYPTTEDEYPIFKYIATTVMPSTNGVSYSTRQYGTTDKVGNYNSAHWIIYRMTDVMLMKAEALALRGDSAARDYDKAFELVKAVYYRSNPYKVAKKDSISYAENSAASIQSLVLAERQRELMFEGKRWYDLVRKALRDGKTDGMLDLMIPNKYDSNQKALRSKMASIDCLFFPIAESELKVNPLLKQNPAYVTETLYEKN